MKTGFFGLIATGMDSRAIGVHNRLIGTKGVIEAETGNVHLRIRQDRREWESTDTAGEISTPLDTSIELLPCGS